MGDPRPGEILLPFDPADHTDAGVCFIGTIRSPWTEETCPKKGKTQAQVTSRGSVVTENAEKAAMNRRTPEKTKPRSAALLKEPGIGNP